MKSNFRKFSGSALLAFTIAALPALSHATSISPRTSISSGNFTSGAISGTVANGDMVTVTITGSLGTFTIDTGTLSGGPGVFAFTGGTLTVVNAQGIFHDHLMFGNVGTSGTGSFSIFAFLEPTPKLTTGSTSFDFGIVNGMINRGNAGVNFEGQLTPIPEPDTLGLFGAGLIGLAGLVRRKLNVAKLVRILAL